MKKLIEHYWETTKHKAKVAKHLLSAASELVRRAVVHDLSKYSYVEARNFSEATHLLSDTEYGSEEYEWIKDEILGEALEHHYENNRHHPEYFARGIHSPHMSFVDLIEMLCDWRAAVERHDDGGGIRDSIQKNRDEYRYSPSRAARMQTTLEQIGAWED